MTTTERGGASAPPRPVRRVTRRLTVAERRLMITALDDALEALMWKRRSRESYGILVASDTEAALRLEEDARKAELRALRDKLAGKPRS